VCGWQPATYDLQRLRRQDFDTVARLVAEHQGVVVGLCRTMGLRGADVEDTAADVFANVYLALPKFDGRAAVSTWVYRIACRTILKAQAKLRRTRKLSGLDSARQVMDPAPQEALEAVETRRRIWEAVAALEPRQAMAVELFYRRDWPLQQVAAVMECPEGTVKTLLFRARQELRRIFLREEIHP